MSVQEDVIDTAPVEEAPQPVVLDPQPEEVKAEEKEPEQTPEQESQERDEKGRFKGVQPRIDELTRKRHEAEREAAYWRGIAQSQAQPSAQAAPQEPKPEQYDDYNVYVRDLAKWEAKQIVAAELAQREAKASEQARVTTWESRQADARKTMPDYDEVVGGSTAPVAGHVSEALQDSEHGPALAYHLAKNPDLLAQLNSLSPRQADREIGRLEERLSAKAQPAPVRTTQAPKPASAVGQGRSVAANPSDMPVEEYIAFRSKGPMKARWAR